MLHLTPASTAASSLHRATGHKNMQMENCELRASDTREVHRSGGLQQSAVTMRCRVWLTAVLQLGALQRCSGIYKFIFAQFLRCACLIRSITAAYPPSPARQAQPAQKWCRGPSLYEWIIGEERGGRQGGHCSSPRQPPFHCIMQNDANNNELYIFGGRWAGGWL